MKDYSFYQTPKSNGVMRFFWNAAGGDRYILERATYSDQIKYMCLGGIVVATGGMAGLAGGYAFYTIFEPRGSAIEYSTNIGTSILAILFGIIWGLIIFNIDRFIVTSTGKGDGNEAITMSEFKSAIPRIIMGSIIALTISKPVEIRMFKTEIDIKLRERQLEQQASYQAKVDSTYSDREKILTVDFDKIETQRKDLINRIKNYESQYQQETAQGLGGRGKGEGPVAKALLREKEKLEGELQQFDSTHQTEISDLNKRKIELRESKDTERSNNEQIANGLDGLLERIKISHEVSGFWISFFITLLFLSIELTPVFFKLMLVKTPYDYLVENRDDMLKAEYGIEVRYDFYKDKDGQERHLTINHESERIIYEKIKLTEIQKELTDYAIEQYKIREKKNIDENLDEYISKAVKDDPSEPQG
jgi:hypothetical protein